jgi:hypothetical protein
MAINVTFNGATIYKPGAYSEEIIDLGGGFPVGPTGLVAIFGESASGVPGSQVPDLSQNVFSPDQLPAIVAEYGSGPIVDACTFLFAPGADGAIPGGAQQVYIYKTNASVQASLALSNTYGTISADAYGVSGNQITYQDVAVPAQPATTSSTATFDSTSSPFVAGGDVFVLRLNGGPSASDNTFTLPATVSPTRATLQSALNAGGNWSGGLPSGITFTVGGGSDAAASITVAQGLGTNPQRNGFGQNFELVSGNLLPVIHIAAGLYTSESEDMSVITIKNNNTLVSESATVGGNIVVSIGRNGGVAPQVTISGNNMYLINNSVHEYTISLSTFPSMYALVQYINGSTAGNWFAELSSTLMGQLPTSALDQVTAVGADGSSTILPAQIKKDSFEVAQFFASSANVSIASQKLVGLPDPQGPTYLAGGALGATASADIVNALTQFQAIRVNSVVPLFSRDASQDIQDGITDPSSTYTIAAIHQAVKTHLSLMATVKEKSERQGYLSLKDTYLNCKLQSQNLADARIQLVIQDIRQVSSLGNIQWFLPWAGACLLAGARGGSPVGLPMTFKYFNMSGIRQTAQLLSTPEAQIVQDFNPGTQYDDAIQNGITFWEKPQTGGFRLVLDNTTYGQDANWVYNRAHVLYAADVLAFDFRSQLENIYVGAKNTVSAAEVKSTCDSILTSYLAQGITVSTADAANGYKQLVVQIVGNTINISVTVKLVEGIDFVLATITLQRASSSA